MKTLFFASQEQNFVLHPLNLVYREKQTKLRERARERIIAEYSLYIFLFFSYVLFLLLSNNKILQSERTLFSNRIGNSKTFSIVGLEVLAQKSEKKSSQKTLKKNSSSIQVKSNDMTSSL
ncbi:hypothetical protein BpHYR1_025429 [Brachionus plicatilis]|uniref:Uncharacterized protein n=1 Tax=Brachionus plicatilis TaxID=10195 RepID=A0A3M7RC87_BRAPC|nr:hypothetical protein BpHYR1_025429 [Brachionus plicatilis]